MRRMSRERTQVADNVHLGAFLLLHTFSRLDPVVSAPDLLHLESPLSLQSAVLRVLSCKMLFP